MLDLMVSGDVAVVHYFAAEGDALGIAACDAVSESCSPFAPGLGSAICRSDLVHSERASTHLHAVTRRSAELSSVDGGVGTI